MTSFLRTRKDRHPKTEGKARLPHELDQSRDNMNGSVERPEIRRAYQDIKEGQLDTDLHGSGGLDDINKKPDQALRKTGEQNRQR